MADAFVDGDGTRWYRSGDSRYDPEQGVYRIVGRLKELIISGGFNVYPLEVEDEIDALRGRARARSSASPIRRAARFRSRSSKPKRASTRGIVAALRDRLASFKIPKESPPRDTAAQRDGKTRQTGFAKASLAKKKKSKLSARAGNVRRVGACQPNSWRGRMVAVRLVSLRYLVCVLTRCCSAGCFARGSRAKLAVDRSQKWFSPNGVPIAKTKKKKKKKKKKIEHFGRPLEHSDSRGDTSTELFDKSATHALRARRFFNVICRQGSSGRFSALSRSSIQEARSLARKKADFAARNGSGQVFRVRIATRNGFPD